MFYCICSNENRGWIKAHRSEKQISINYAGIEAVGVFLGQMGLPNCQIKLLLAIMAGVYV